MRQPRLVPHVRHRQRSAGGPKDPRGALHTPQATVPPHRPQWPLHPAPGVGGATTTGLDATPAQLSIKTCVSGGGGRSGGMGGGVSVRVEGVLAASPRGGGCAQPTTITCTPQGGIWGMGVWGYVCDHSDKLCLLGSKS